VDRLEDMQVAVERSERSRLLAFGAWPRSDVLHRRSPRGEKPPPGRGLADAALDHSPTRQPKIGGPTDVVGVSRNDKTLLRLATSVGAHGLGGAGKLRALVR
jgi:hypothetical protein